MRWSWHLNNNNYFFVLAYGNNTNKSSASQNFYCEVCDKKLNGPIPYDVHLNSKAHKEEVAIREEFNYQWKLLLMYLLFLYVEITLTCVEVCCCYFFWPSVWNLDLEFMYK